jgi:hydrophobe/amphiphile efflux-3 (HAE3) family protein
VNTLISWVLRWPAIVVVLFVALTIGCATLLPRVQIDPEIKNQLPSDMPARVDTARIEEVFGGTERILLVLEADDILEPAVLDQLQRLTDGLAEVEGVERVLSIFRIPRLEATPDGIDPAPIVTDLPATPDDKAALRKRIETNPLVAGTVISKDFKAAAILGILAPGAEDTKTIEGARALIESTTGPGTVSLGGMPGVRVQVSEDIRNDLRRFVPVGVLVLLAVQWICFRQVRGVVLPTLVVISTEIVTLSLLPLFDWSMQIMMVTMPVMLLAVGNSYSINLLAYHQEQVPPDGKISARALAHKMAYDLYPPLLADCVAMVAGFFALATHIVVPAQRLGVLTGIGVTYALVASLTFIPALLAMMPVPKPFPPPSEGSETPFLERWLARISPVVIRHPKRVVAGTIVAVLLVAAGLPRLSVDTNPVNYYAEGAPIRTTAEMIDKHFGGLTEVLVMVNGDTRDPAVLARVDEIERTIADMDHVGTTSSVASLLRRVHQALGRPDDTDLPGSRELIAQELSLIEMGDSAALASLVDFGFEHTLITARIDSISTVDVAEVVDAVKGEVANDPVVVGGFGVVFTDLVDAMLEGQNESLVVAIVVVFALCVISFRSVTAGLYCLAPLLVGIPVLYGLMGHFGIDLNVVTAMLSSIVVGVGVDYTINFLWRVKASRALGLGIDAAVHRSIVTVGRPILFAALSTSAGFGVLLVSAFVPVKSFGFLIVAALTACALAALFLLPALCVWFDPKFLDPPGYVRSGRS